MTERCEHEPDALVGHREALAQALLRVAQEESRSRRPRALRASRLIAVVAVACIAGLVFVSLGDGPGGGRQSGTAWAAEQIRFAEASPLVLLDVDGWRVAYADEQSIDQGNLRFQTGPAQAPQTTPARPCTYSVPGPGSQATPVPFPPSCDPVPADTTAAELDWRPEGRDYHLYDEAVSTVPVLGTTAQIYQGPGGVPGARYFTAVWQYDGRVLELSGGAADADAFGRLVTSMKAVDTDTWLSAMPPSAIRTTERSRTIDDMLKGIPLPAGFDPSHIRGSELLSDRYQLGAAVSGTVSCLWLRQWKDGRDSGDTGAVNDAIAAMSTAKTWPILLEMAKQGGYPDAIWEYAAAMPSGEYSQHHYPLADVAPRGLGCARLGVEFHEP